MIRLLLRQPGAGSSVVCFSKDVKVPVKVRRTLSSVGTSASKFILSWLLTGQTNGKDFVDAKCRCNFVNWESTSQNTQGLNILTKVTVEYYSKFE